MTPPETPEQVAQRLCLHCKSTGRTRKFRDEPGRRLEVEEIPCPQCPAIAAELRKRDDETAALRARVEELERALWDCVEAFGDCECPGPEAPEAPEAPCLDASCSCQLCHGPQVAHLLPESRP